MVNNTKNNILNSTSGEDIIVTEEGSLGLLALGDVGLYLWREQIEKKKEELHISQSTNLQR